MKKSDVLIVGAGLSGLCAALHLQKKGYRVHLVEAEDRPGGRVKTDEVEGFLLDRGFQVLLTAYPEAQLMLDYYGLDLKSFLPGAMVINESGTHRIGDPMRQPSVLFSTLLSGIGSLADKLRILKVRGRLKGMSLKEIFSQKEIATRAALKEYGFGEGMISDFFTPFFRGIFLEKDLSTSRRMFDFVFKMFGEGEAAVPARGMEAIPRQLADRIGEEHFTFHTRVSAAEPGAVVTESGERLEARAVVLAVEGRSPLVMPYRDDAALTAEPRKVTCVYFAAPKPPVKGPLLVLKAAPEGLVNNLCVMSELSPACAPEGQALISVSLIGLHAQDDDVLAEAIRTELRPWFAGEVENWRHLRTYRIDYALPGLASIQDDPGAEGVQQIEEGVFLAGDFLLNGSIHAAMKSGRLAAQAVDQYLR